MSEKASAEGSAGELVLYATEDGQSRLFLRAGERHRLLRRGRVRRRILVRARSALALQARLPSPQRCRSGLIQGQTAR